MVNYNKDKFLTKVNNIYINKINELNIIKDK
jgi:hypothetical protein